MGIIIMAQLKVGSKAIISYSYG